MRLAHGGPMFKNYLKTALRDLTNRKLYSFINIAGLSIGFALSILILSFVRNEYSYDDFHEDAGSIYRVWQEWDTPDRGIAQFSLTPIPLSGTLKENFPEISEVVRISTSTSAVRYREFSDSERTTFVDPSFFEVFSFPIIAGAPIDEPDAVVISEKMARKYFGDTDPIGQTLQIQLSDSLHHFRVAAVARNVVQNSSITFDFLLHYEKFRTLISPNWFTYFGINICETFVKLRRGASASELQAKLPAISQYFREANENRGNYKLFLQPITNIHLNTDVPVGETEISNPVYSYILAGLGFLVLFIACVNFVILATGRAAGRAKEVGVRKTMGAFKHQLAQQFIGEAVLICLIALVVGFMLAGFLLPVFNSLSGKQLALQADSVMISIGILLVAIVGFAAGSYPAFILARLHPTTVFKGALPGHGKNLLSKGLVVLQFGLSISLILATLVMHEQLEFMRERDLGYEKERVVQVSLNSPQTRRAAEQIFGLYQNEILDSDKVISMTGVFNEFGVKWTTLGFNEDDGTYREFNYNRVDYDFLETMGVELVEGRDFSRSYGTDAQDAIIVNEAFVRGFGWNDPLNSKLPGDFSDALKVIGVVKDFNYGSLHSEIQPLVLALNYNTVGSGISRLSSENWPPVLQFALVRISPGETGAIVDFLRQSWQKVHPDAPFTLTFLDESIDAQYDQEKLWGKVFNYAASIAIVVACLGLFGLATVTVEKRIKEIGIRKVLGASVIGIFSLISRKLLVLVALSNIIAWPLAWLTMNKWLEDFAYRIEITLWMFALAGSTALLIALLTVSVQAIRAALRNPVDALRYE